MRNRKLMAAALLLLSIGCGSYAELGRVMRSGHDASSDQDLSGVTVWRNGQKVPASSKMALRIGDTIETGPEHTAAVTFDGAMAVMASNSKIGLILGGIKDWFHDVFNSGWLNGESKLVTAAHAGTEYLLSVDPATQHTTVTVLEGKVRVTPKDRPAAGLVVGARQRVTVDDSGKALVVEELDGEALNRLIETSNMARDTLNAPMIPDLRGQLLDEAIRKLDALRDVTSVISGAVPPPGSGATVESQEPAPGVRAHRVHLTYSVPRTSGALEPGPRAVTAGGATVNAPRTVEAGTSFSFTWTGPDQDTHHLQLVPVGTDDKMSLQSLVVSAKSRQPATLLAPAHRGAYELRYASDSLILARSNVTVTEPRAAKIGAPPQLEAGSELEFTWSGPNHPTDRVRLVETNANSGSEYPALTVQADSSQPAKIRLPANAGDYELRYALGGERFGADDFILARHKLTVTDAQASITAPSKVEAGSEFQLSWTGPRHATDSVSMMPVGSGDSSYNSEHALQADHATPAPMRAPGKPGEYELRYVLGKSLQGRPIVVPARAKITVTAASAALTAPARVKAGTQFNVSWKGPHRSKDSVLIVRAGAADNAYLIGSGYALDASTQNSGSMHAPSEPGAYELRYVLIGEAVIARRAIAITAP